VSAEIHRRLKARAAIEGMSMSDYILREVRKALDRHTRQEIIKRLRPGLAGIEDTMQTSHGFPAVGDPS
jgi:hypothetical protein